MCIRDSYSTVSVMLMYILPLVVMVIAYCLILCSVARKSRLLGSFTTLYYWHRLCNRRFCHKFHFRRFIFFRFFFCVVLLATGQQRKARDTRHTTRHCRPIIYNVLVVMSTSLLSADIARDVRHRYVLFTRYLTAYWSRM